MDSDKVKGFEDCIDAVPQTPNELALRAATHYISKLRLSADKNEHIECEKYPRSRNAPSLRRQLCYINDGSRTSDGTVVTLHGNRTKKGKPYYKSQLIKNRELHAYLESQMRD